MGDLAGTVEGMDTIVDHEAERKLAAAEAAERCRELCLQAAERALLRRWAESVPLVRNDPLSLAAHDVELAAGAQRNL